MANKIRHIPSDLLLGSHTFAVDAVNDFSIFLLKEAKNFL